VITSLIQLKLFYRNILRIVKAYYENILGIDISISDGYKCITGVISNLGHFFTNEATATEKGSPYADALSFKEVPWLI
jgi:hypothetical protein